jgi:hypothetical protein
MADHLYLSYWIRGFSAMSMIRHFDRTLRQFPFSPVNPASSVLRIEAVAASEPPLLEHPFTDPVDVDQVVEAARDFQHADCAYIFESWWGLWQLGVEWELRPSKVSIALYGPQYADTPAEPGDEPEHIRIDFGLDSQYLPQPHIPNSAYYVQSNLKGLLHLVHSLDEVLTYDRRQLWSESGENFADKLQQLTDRTR